MEAVARSLDGGLDIVPQAIADDLVDQARKDQGRDKVEIQFEEWSSRASEDAEGAPGASGDGPPPTAPSPEEEARLGALLARLNTRERRLAEGRLAGLNQAEIAQRLGVTDRTIRDMITKLRLKLKPLLESD